MQLQTTQILEFINRRLSNIEKKISSIEEKVDFSIDLQRNHLIKIKNGDILDDNMILMGSPYNDLSPTQAYESFSNKTKDLILLDVSKNGYTPINKISCSLKIPLEELPQKYSDLQSRIIPIMVISEKGIRSIQACEFLITKGFFNVNNVSGGYKFWPKQEEIKPQLNN